MTTINSHRDEHGKAAATSSAPNHEDVARSAYEIYQRRGSQPGQDVENWLTAESRLRSMHATTAHNIPALPKVANQMIR